MFVCTASNGLYSQTGTCLSAAAWTIMSTPRVARTRRVAVAHVADQVAQPVVVGEAALQVPLLELVAAEDPDRPRSVLLAEQALDEARAERSRSRR